MVILISGGEEMDNDGKDRNRTDNKTRDWDIGEILIRVLVLKTLSYFLDFT